MKNTHKLIIHGVIILMLLGNVFAQEEKTIHKSFDGKQKVRIRTVSGNCVINQAETDKIQLDLVYSEQLEQAFEPEFSESKNVLKLTERWYGSSVSGQITWKITVPPKTEIDFSTASGDLSIEGMNSSFKANTASGEITVENSAGEFDFNTASGDIYVEKVSGELDLSTASGDIEAYDLQGELDFSTASGEIDISGSKGIFYLSCASGDIDASDIVIDEESTFSTASGKVQIKLAKSSEYDLELSSASGSVTLDYNGNPMRGYFEFTARKRGGKIQSAVEFEVEEEFERNDQIYVRKSFTKDSEKPVILIETASGKAILKK